MRVASWWLKDFVTGPVAAENCRAQTSYSTGENSVVLGGWWVATYIICCFGFGGWWEELWCWWGWWVMGDGRLRKRFLEVQVGVWVFRSNNYCCWSGQIQQLFSQQTTTNKNNKPTAAKIIQSCRQTASRRALTANHSAKSCNNPPACCLQRAHNFSIGQP